MPRDNLLKEALADARKIKEIAVENAKLQLEESLKPQIASAVSKRLRNESALEEESLGTSGIGAGLTVDEPAPKNPTKKAWGSSNIENPGQEVEDFGEGETHKKPIKEAGLPGEEDELGLDDPTGVPKAPAAPVAKAPVAPAAPTGAPVAPAGVPGTELDLDVSPDGHGGEEFNMDFGGEGEGHGDELDLEAIIRELEAESQAGTQPALEGFDDPMAGAKVDGPITVGKVQEDAGGVFDDGEAPKAVDGVNGGKKVSPGQEVTGTKAERMSEEIDLDEILREMEAEDESVDESTQIVSENVELKRSLREHREVIQYLRTKLHEVNMLNSKLLFTTKLFRAFNLSEGQKTKIVETFDRAATLREVKLVYATLAESLQGNRSGKKSATVVTEGLASKPIGSTKPKSETILAEGNDMVARMKKLAGISQQ
jgi:hypothetical protein